MAVVGNIIVALVLSMSVIIIGFDIYPYTSAENQIAMANLFSILLDYAIFAL
jgi:4-hydroxybenzoate polyprenyltransferase